MKIIQDNGDSGYEAEIATIRLSMAPILTAHLSRKFFRQVTVTRTHLTAKNIIAVLAGGSQHVHW